LETEEKPDARCCSVPVTVNEGVENGSTFPTRLGAGQSCTREAGPCDLGIERNGPTPLLGRTLARHGMARHGMAWYGVVWHGAVQRGIAAR